MIVTRECDDPEVVLQVLVPTTRGAASVEVIDVQTHPIDETAFEKPHLGSQALLLLAVGLHEDGYAIVDIDIRNRSFGELDADMESTLKSRSLRSLNRGSWRRVIEVLSTAPETAVIWSVRVSSPDEASAGLEAQIDRQGVIRVRPNGRSTSALEDDVKRAWITWLTG